MKNGDWLDQHEVFGEDPVHSDQDELCTTPLRPGRPQKSFDECGIATKRARVHELVENISPNELRFAAEMATRASGSRITAQALKAVSESPEEAKRIVAAKEELDKQQIMTGEEALALYVDNHLTSRSYKDIRKKALRKGHFLYPSLYALRRVNSECILRTDFVDIDDISVRPKIQALLNLTIERLMIAIKTVINEKIADGASLTLVGKRGADGSSGQSLYKQKFNDSSNTDEFIFMISYVPLKLHVTGDSTKVIWQNPNCSSTRLCRPFAFVFAKETKEMALEEIEKI